MDSEEWKILKQAAIRFELKTGLSVDVTASRQGQTRFQFSTDHKSSSDTRSISSSGIGSRGFSSALNTTEHSMSYAGYELSSRRTVHQMPVRSAECPPPISTMSNDDPFADENENQSEPPPPEDDIDFGEDSDDLDLGDSRMSGSIAIKAKQIQPSKTSMPSKYDDDAVACSAPIKMRSSYVMPSTRRNNDDSPVSESYYGSKMHSQHLNKAAQY